MGDVIANLLFCPMCDKEMYIEDGNKVNCPLCGNSLMTILDEYGAVKGNKVSIDDRYVIKPEKYEIEKCYECGEEIILDPDRRGETWICMHIHHNPFDNEGEEVFFHINNEKDFDCGYGDCYDRASDTSWADFRLFTCDFCERTMNRQNPTNGYHSFVKLINDYQEICLACYQELLFKGDVLPIEKGTHINGMFFYREDLEQAGFKEFDSFFVKLGSQNLKDYAKIVNELVSEGNIVVNQFDTLSILGDEGYLTVWIKKKEV